MTLAEWEAEGGLETAVRRTPGRARYVEDTYELAVSGLRPRLWELDDYFVEGVRGGLIWLMPR
jgi:hypothetical protein